MERYAIVRTDRIGDLILSLPVAEAIKESKPAAEVYYVVSPRTSEIARACPFIDGIIEFDEAWNSPAYVARLARQVRDLHPDVTILLRPTMKAALALVLGGARHRVGTSYRYYSWLFNHRVREHRKYAERHEVEYNLNCLRAVLEIKSRTYRPRIELDSDSSASAQEALQERGLKGKDFIIIHPGFGGSARNLPLSLYAKLADTVESEFNIPVLVTAEETEMAVVNKMDRYRSRKSVSLVNVSRLLDLAAVIKESKVFVSGSTGPMHMAAAVQTPTISFFSPVRSCSPRRWKPMGDANIIIMPAVPECQTCVGTKCEYYDCMERIDLIKITEAIRTLLSH